MKAKAIVLPRENTPSSQISEKGWNTLVKSSRKVGNNFEIERFDAITPDTMQEPLRDLEEKGIRWNYPFEGSEIDFKSGLVKKAYFGDRANRISCFLSHYALWEECANQDEIYLILEHDAVFINPLETELLIGNPEITRIVGINDPHGATRRARHFHDRIQNRNGGVPGVYVMGVPIIDRPEIPQGLAGNSAYLMTPSAAKEMLTLVQTYGMWPNDALMCYQLMRGALKVSLRYYTRVQGLQSTTVWQR